MCLLIRDKDPKIAQEDIVCYKILECSRRRDSWKTPFRQFEVEFDKLLADENKVFPKKLQTDSEYNLYSVEKGCFHTFRDMYDARKISYSNGFGYCKVFKCVIPKGTEYYAGISFALDSYASKKLIVTKEQV